jgi:pyruvate dehydrogenase E2 component (dihydrolipoamide acetyltransferase)
VEALSTNHEPSGLKGEIRIAEPTRAQAAIARRTAEVRATVPDLELGREVEVAAALALAAQRGCARTAVLVRACALALHDCPQANSAYRDGHYELYSRINVGVTLHRPGGYITPTVLDADAKTLEQIHREIEAFTRQAAAGELTPPQLAGATFTLTDMTEREADRWSALVTPPQAAAITAGRLRSAPVVRDGRVAASQVLALTLACDHRVLFGLEAAEFLGAIAAHLERSQL